MVKQRLMQPDVEQNGWLLDGYPRSFSQAMALENLEIRPDIFILLEVWHFTLISTLLACIHLYFVLISYYLKKKYPVYKCMWSPKTGARMQTQNEAILVIFEKYGSARHLVSSC